MDSDQILMDAEERMEKAATVLQEQLGGLRTGRANAGLVDSVRVDCYGSQTPLKQIANVTVPEPQQIAIRPFDGSLVQAIVKAIQTSELGLSPLSDGKIIRLNIPSLSTERRKQLASRTKELAEDARVAIRNIRRDANKHIDTAHKDKLLTEDERDGAKEEIQGYTKKYEGMVNSAASEKESQIMNE